MSTPVSISLFSLLVIGVLVVGLSVGSGQGRGDDGGAAASIVQPPISRVAPSSTGRLLDLAQRAASKLPAAPHIKTRSRLQESVVATCLELDLPIAAERYAENIENWRRGTAIADLAIYRILSEDTKPVPALLARAERAAKDEAALAESQQWRSDRVRLKIAQAHLLMGDTKAARSISRDLDSAELGKIESLRAERLSAEDYPAHLKALDAFMLTATLDQAQTALINYCTLYRRFFGDVSKRIQIESRVLDGREKLPPLLRIDAIQRLVRVAAESEDLKTGRRLLRAARKVASEQDWRPRDEIPLLARLSEHAALLQDPAAARRDIANALQVYEANEPQVYDIFRSRLLCPIAEAYLAMGNQSDAETIYLRAIEEGLRNPNSRPRSEDLVAICNSMAGHAFEPSKGVWAALDRGYGLLGSPW